MQLIHTYYGCQGDGRATTVALPVDTESKDFAESQIFWAIVDAAYAGAPTFEALGHTHHTHNFLTHLPTAELDDLKHQAANGKARLPMMAQIEGQTYALRTGKLLTMDEWQGEAKSC